MTTTRKMIHPVTGQPQTVATCHANPAARKNDDAKRNVIRRARAKRFAKLS